MTLLVLGRIVASAGFGAVYATKRRASVEDSPKRREFLFLLLELSSSFGMASGPMLAGLFAYLLPRCAQRVYWRHHSYFGVRGRTDCCGGPAALQASAHVRCRVCHSFVLQGPPIVMIVLVLLLYLTRIESTDLDEPYFKEEQYFEEDKLARADEEPLAPQNGHDAEEEPRNGHGVHDAPAKPAGSLPPVWASASVTAACLAFGVGRNFLKFGFESAMVVVYDRQFGFSVDVAGARARKNVTCLPLLYAEGPEAVLSETVSLSPVCARRG